MKKKLIQLANTLVVTIPNKEFLEKFHLKKGDVVDMIMTDDVILIKDQSVDVSADIIKDELELVEVTLELKAKSDDLRLLKTLTPAERAESMKTRRELAGEAELSGDIVHMDSPYWNQKPREPCDPETLKLWAKLHPDLAKKEAEKASKVDNKEWLLKMTPEERTKLRKYWAEMLKFSQEFDEENKEKSDGKCRKIT